MARPRSFDEDEVLDAAIRCFWARGYEATSVRDLASGTGLTCASLYNAFGDKRALYGRALGRYADQTVGERIRRIEAAGLSPRAAIEAFFHEVIDRSLGDAEMKGCMIVNAAVELGPHDAELRAAAIGMLGDIEGFFRRRVEEGQASHAIRAGDAEDMARMLSGVLLGIRVLARIRPERPLLEGVLRPALAGLDPAG